MPRRRGRRVGVEGHIHEMRQVANAQAEVKRGEGNLVRCVPSTARTRSTTDVISDASCGQTSALSPASFVGRTKERAVIAACHMQLKQHLMKRNRRVLFKLHVASGQVIGLLVAKGIGR